MSDMHRSAVLLLKPLLPIPKTMGFFVFRGVMYASIHVLPAFERVNEGNFNGRVKLFNEEIKAFYAKDHNYEYIENRLIFSHNKSEGC
jgi:hypothetical protein